MIIKIRIVMRIVMSKTKIKKIKIKNKQLNKYKDRKPKIDRIHKIKDTIKYKTNK